MLKLPENPNRLLLHQIKKSFPDGSFTADNVNEFIKQVNSAYTSTEEDRLFYQRAEKISNQEIEETNKNLQDKNDFLDSFNHGMAHDVKNHTSNIIGLINMLKKYTEKKNIEMIRQINERLDLSANQLTSIVQGFLYLSRSESKIDNQFALIDGNDLIEKINVETQFLTIGKNVNINYHFNIENLFFSRHILKIIFVNLISNAIKYGKPNEDNTVDVTLTNTNTQVNLVVKDSGIGIDLEHADKKLYNLFNQHGNKNEAKGFGVGLFLVKKIVDRNNGEIKLDSQLGVGTNVQVQFLLANNH